MGFYHFKKRYNFSPRGTGQWKQVNESMSQHSRNFQNHVTTGAKNGMVYEVRGVRFDGFRNGTLLEAKGNYSQFVNKNTGQFHPWFRGGDALRNQAAKQVNAANGTPIQWHFNDATSMNAVKRYLGNIQGIEFVLNPMP